MMFKTDRARISTELTTAMTIKLHPSQDLYRERKRDRTVMMFRHTPAKFSTERRRATTQQRRSGNASPSRSVGGSASRPCGCTLRTSGWARRSRHTAWCCAPSTPHRARSPPCAPPPPVCPTPSPVHDQCAPFMETHLLRMIIICWYSC